MYITVASGDFAKLDTRSGIYVYVLHIIHICIQLKFQVVTEGDEVTTIRPSYRTPT